MAITNDLTYYCYMFITWILAIFVMHFIMKTYSRTKISDPPGPMALPIIGHLHLLSSRLAKSLETLASRYGPIMKIRMGSIPIIVVSNSDLAKEMLKIHDVDFASKFSLGFGLANFDIYDQFTFVNAQYGSYWRFMKKLCMTQLFAGAQIDRFTHIREEDTTAFLKSIMKKSKSGEPCDLGKELPKLSNRIICRMAIGKRCEENPNLPVEIRKLARGMMEAAAKLSFIEVFGPLKKFDIFGNGRRLQMVTWEYDKLMEQMMKKYEDDYEKKGCEKEGKDVMDILIEIHKDTEAELELTRNHIKKFFLDIFFAGADTIAAAIQFAIAELINNPNIMKKLRNEIDTVVGSDRLIKESDIPKLPYLQAVVKETMRVHPAGPLLRRQCNVDTKINGYDIKAGTRILINAYAIMRDPKTWKNPDEFQPERFLSDELKQVDFNGQDFCFLPFGSGRRGCLGKTHGLIVTQMTIGALVQCFDWEVKDVDKIDIKLVTGYSGAMALPLVCYPITRFDPFM